MVRNFKRKTEKRKAPADVLLRAAARLVKLNGSSKRKAAADFKSGFRVSGQGVRDIFTDEEFLTSSVTERSDPGLLSEGTRPDPGILNEEARPDPGILNEEARPDPDILDEEETPSLTNNTQEINKTIQESKITSKTTITKPVLLLKKTKESTSVSGVQNAKRHIHTSPNHPCCSGLARQNTRNIVTGKSETLSKGIGKKNE
ncbi:hypothetical protein JTB14_026143 [Gonioctena quinquepunctata]|nr:hypothetical protein JTB14_026143 [Gonioctena quinquepunctata]